MMHEIKESKGPFLLKSLTADDISEIITLIHATHKDNSKKVLGDRLFQMFSMHLYDCVGLYFNEELVAVCSMWTSVRLNSGKHLELDSIAIKTDTKAKRVEDTLFSMVEKWAKKNKYRHLELDAFVNQHHSHKFYHRRNYQIWGFHFVKRLVKK